MKKYLYIAIIVSFFVFSHNTFATSGACSDHGGVSCSAGASADGNAICNDGFESSISYYNMQECANNIYDPIFYCHSNFGINSYPETQSSVKDKANKLLADSFSKLKIPTSGSFNQDGSATLVYTDGTTKTFPTSPYTTPASELSIFISFMDAGFGYDGTISQTAIDFTPFAFMGGIPIQQALTDIKNTFVKSYSSYTHCSCPDGSMSNYVDTSSSEIPNFINKCATTSEITTIPTIEKTDTLPVVIAPQTVSTPTPTTQTVKAPKVKEFFNNSLKPIKQTTTTPISQQNITQTTQSIVPTPTPQKEGFFKKVWGFLVNYFKPIKK